MVYFRSHPPKINIFDRVKWLSFITVLIIVSCGKPQQWDGCVLDKNGNPIHNANVHIGYSLSGQSAPEEWVEVKTNTKGVFVYRQKSNSKKTAREISATAGKLQQTERRTLNGPESNIILQLQ